MPLDDTHYVVSAIEDTSESKDFLPVVSDLDPDLYKRTGPIAKGGNPNSREQLGMIQIRACQRTLQLIEKLDQDEKEAIDPSNIIEPRTRAQDPNSKTGKYTMLDPEQDEGLMAGTTPDGPFVEAVQDEGGYVEIASESEEEQ
jgi:hypothetical protein